jgi:hypothetical protein
MRNQYSGGKEMKNVCMILALGMIAAFPLIGNATPLGIATLNVFASGPDVYSTPHGTISGDYDGLVFNPIAPFGYAIGSTSNPVEIFCVEGVNLANSSQNEFYAIDSTLAQGLQRAAWIADQFSMGPVYNAADNTKVEYQKAIWAVLGVITVGDLGGSGMDFNLYNSATAIASYSTPYWYLAHTPITGSTANYQDFLTPVNPVPEPGTVLLLGSGLIGLVVFGKRKFF